MAHQRVVLITGASSGIGRACAEHLARSGYRVFGTSRRSGTAEPPGVEMVEMDVCDEDSVRRGVEQVHQLAGRLDAVINNAGGAWMGAVEETSVEEARAQFEANFFGVLRVCRAVLPIMRGQGAGHIINMSSLAGVLGLPFSGLYSASKFALEGMTESLRLEVRRFGMRVVLIQPGDHKTGLPDARQMTRASQSEAYRDAFHKLKAAPLKRLLTQRLFEWVLSRVLDLP